MRYINWIKEGQVSFLMLMLAVFLLPVSRELFIIALWPWILFRLLEGLLNRNFPGMLIQKKNISLYFLPLMYLLLLLSLIWSENRLEGLQHAGRSLLMIIFPLVLGTDVKVLQDRSRVPVLLRVYVAGATLSLFFLWIYALIYSLSIEEGRIVFNPLVGDWENAFFHNAFSFLIHPTYFGMMILMAAAICLNKTRSTSPFFRSSVIPVLLACVFLGSLFFISSRAMMVAGVFLVAYHIFIRITSKKILIPALLTGIVILFLIISLHPRFGELRKMIGEGSGIITLEQLTETTDRGKAWKASTKLISEHPLLGVGIGDVRDSMIAEYSEMDYRSDTDPYLNCHNQFLETWTGYGFPGILLLILTMLFPLIRPGIDNRFLYNGFLMICLIAFLFESVLNRLWGVAFFTLFYLLLANPSADLKGCR